MERQSKKEIITFISNKQTLDKGLDMLEESNNYKVDDDNYIFEGKIMIHDLCRIMKLPMDTFDQIKGNSESLAGLLLEVAGEFPTEDWVIPCGDFEFAIMKADNNRIQLVKVTIKPKQ